MTNQLKRFFQLGNKEVQKRFNFSSMKTPRRVKEQIEHAVVKGMISVKETISSERGDVPGWVLVVLMTTGLVTGIWTLAAPRIDSILRNSLDSMNGIR